MKIMIILDRNGCKIVILMSIARVSNVNALSHLKIMRSMHENTWIIYMLAKLINEYNMFGFPVPSLENWK